MFGEIGFLTSVISPIISLVVSILFFVLLHSTSPTQSICLENESYYRFEVIAQYLLLILLPFVVWAIVFNGSLTRLFISLISWICSQLNIMLIDDIPWKQVNLRNSQNTLSSESTRNVNNTASDLQNNLVDQNTSSSSNTNKNITSMYSLLKQWGYDDQEASPIGGTSLDFLDRWILVVISNMAFIPLIVMYGAKMFTESDEIYATATLVPLLFEIWAIGLLFNQSCLLLSERTSHVNELWKSNKLPLQISHYVALVGTIIILTLIFVGKYYSEMYYLIALLINISVLSYQVKLLLSLIKALHDCNYDLIAAVVVPSGGDNMNSIDSQARLDAVFRPTLLRSSDIGATAPLQNSVIPEHTISADSYRLSIASTIANKSREYSLIYLELQKMLDLLKMVITVVYISIISNLANILVLYAINYDGNHSIVLMIRTVAILIPLVYQFVYRWNMKNNNAASAVSDARYASLYLLYAGIIVTMSVVGGNLACDLLGTDHASNGYFRGSAIKTFLLYVAKTTALPTTVTFGIVFLSSPGIRSFFSLSLFAQYLLVPLIWLPPFTMEIIHKASGANFVVLGIVHGLAWIYILLPSDIDPIITGILMLIITIKLMWPTGYTMPFIGPKSSPYLVAIDSFLKDSKYGAYHVYLALAIFVLYVIHVTYLFDYMYSPYFLFSAFGWAVTRYLIIPRKSIIYSKLCPLKYTVIEKIVTPIKKNSLYIVKLIVSLSPETDLKHFEENSEIIMLRNYTILQNDLLCGFINPFRYLRTPHYFSVANVKINRQKLIDRAMTVSVSANSLHENVSSEPITAEVSLLIQKTRRVGGVASTLVTTKDEISADSKWIYDMEVMGFTKSNVSEALYSPCVIAYTFESGAAATCSLLRNRCTMRNHIENLMKRAFSISSELGQSPSVKNDHPTGLTDLCVVWTTFTKRGKKAIDAELVSKCALELAQLQSFLHENSGGRTVKMLFVTTGVPIEWTPDEECIIPKRSGVEEQVASILGYSPDIVRREAWREVSIIEPFNRGGENDDLDERNNSIFGLSVITRDEQINEFKEPENSKSGERSGPILKQNSNDPRRSSLFNIKLYNHNDIMSLSTNRPNGSIDPISLLLQVHSKEESWVPMRHALGASWKEFKRILDRRVESAIRWLCMPNGPDFTTLFVTEHESDVHALKDFRYSEIYDEINRSIMESQLRYTKNPEEFLDDKLDNDDRDPINPSPIACSILYSGDFSSSKKSHLYSTLCRVKEAQQNVRVPAALTFVPDG
eukprot:gene5024-7012_t